MFTLAVAAPAPVPAAAAAPAPSPQSSSSTTLHKYRDSKISRIQPYVPMDTHRAAVATVLEPRNQMHNENDASIKYHHANKFGSENHTHKKFGLETKKKGSSNHELLK